MSLDAELQAFLKSDIDRVVAHSEVFRKKLGIGRKAFKLLSKVETAELALTSAASGGGVAGAAYLGWMSTLGLGAEVGLLVGIIITPVGWVAAAGVAGSSAFFVLRRLMEHLRQTAVEETPKFLNSPIDILGASLMDFFGPVISKMALADGKVSDEEIDTASRYLIDEWGFDWVYVRTKLRFDAAHLGDWDWNTLSSLLLKLERTGDVSTEIFRSELVAVARRIAASDGHVSDGEAKELRELEKALGLSYSQKGWINRIFLGCKLFLIRLFGWWKPG